LEQFCRERENRHALLLFTANKFRLHLENRCDGLHDLLNTEANEPYCLL